MTIREIIKGFQFLKKDTVNPGRFFPENLEGCRILHIGSYTFRKQNSMVRHMMIGLKDAGAEVFEFNTDEHPESLDTDGRPYDSGTFGPVWIREEYISKYVTSFSPHIIICNAGGLSFRPDYSRKLRQKIYLLGIALSDPDVFAPTTSRIANNFDLFLTNDPALIQSYKKLGANAEVLRLGTNINFFRPLPPLEKYKADVIIVGRCLPNRVEAVKRIINNFHALIFGEGWEEHGISSLGTIYGDDLMHALNSAKIAPVFLQNQDATSMFVKIAVLDFPSAGALVITNQIAAVEDYLTFGKEIVGFTSEDDLINKIEYYLSHPEEAEIIRRAGHERVRREHKWSMAWQENFRLLRQISLPHN